MSERPYRWMSRPRWVGLCALLAAASILVVQVSGWGGAHRIGQFAGWSKKAAARVNPAISGVQPHLATGSTVVPPVQVDLVAPKICVAVGHTPGHFVVNEPAVAQSTDDRGVFAVIAQRCAITSSAPPTAGVPVVFATKNGGQSWVGTPLTLQNRIGADTVIVYDPAHHVFVAAFLDVSDVSRDHPSQVGRLAVQASSDGVRWTNDTTLFVSQTPVLESHLPPGAPRFPKFTDADRPYITVDTNSGSPHFGRVAVSYTIFNFDHNQIQQGQDIGMSYTDDPTKPNNWIAQNPAAHNSQVQGSTMAFSASGDLLMVWWSGDLVPVPGDRKKELKQRLWPHDEPTWDPAEPRVALISNLNSRGAPCPLTSGVTQLNTTCDSFPSVASYPPVTRANGKRSDSGFVVVWADYDSGTPKIRGKVTENDGADWNSGPGPGQFDGKEFVVDCCGGTGSGAQQGAKFNPHVAIAPNGRIDIGYMSSEQSVQGSGGLGTTYQYFIAEAANLEALEQGKLDTPVAVDPNESAPATPTFVGDYSWVSSNTSTDTAAAYTSVDSGQNTHITFIRICYPTC